MTDDDIRGAWVNKKSGRTYLARRLVTNATNAQDGQTMVEYEPLSSLIDATARPYVRELNEFLEKFERRM